MTDDEEEKRHRPKKFDKEKAKIQKKLREVLERRREEEESGADMDIYRENTGPIKPTKPPEKGN